MESGTERYYNQQNKKILSLVKNMYEHMELHKQKELNQNGAIGYDAYR